MAKLNIVKLSHLAAGALDEFVRARAAAIKTHEGGPALMVSPELALRRSVLACVLWEDQFYEDGVAIAERICELVPKVEAAKVSALAIEARNAMKLRHVPLLVVREMARYATHRGSVAETLARVIQRADELAEFLAIYWKDGRVPLSGQVKKGLAAAFTKFDEYALAKYDRAGTIQLRDVLFLCHAKPKDAEQAAVWKRLIAGELATPDTWEVALSAGGGKGTRDTWERLLAERKLGALALLRNLRNMKEAGVKDELVFEALATMKTERVLPLRFLAAARHVPQWEEPLETAMLRTLAGHENLPGQTVVLVDVSGSMVAPTSRRSEMLRTDAAYGLAVFLREIAEKVTVYTFSDVLKMVPPRRGFALRDAMENSQPHNGTNLGAALNQIHDVTETYDRVVVITDEQSSDRVPGPRGRGYMINVASYRNGVGYGRWTHIDGWSEAVIEYIHESERSN